MYSAHIAHRFFENGKAIDQEIFSAVTIDVLLTKLKIFKAQNSQFNHHHFYFTSNNDDRSDGQLTQAAVENLV
jgi:hypothetical protein